jgi:Uma2 family endonuclease
MLVPEVIVQRRLTFDDYQKLPDDQDYEIIEGVLYVSPRARARHQITVSNFAVVLITHARERGLGTVVLDADLIVEPDDTYVSPDLMFFTADRFTHVNPDDWIRVMPDLIVEVLSPGTEHYDRSTKRETYERLGVRNYWIADPRRRSILELVLGSDGRYRERAIRIPERFRPTLFPDLEIDLGDVFPTA